MAKCPVCDYEIPDGSKFCNECGYSFIGSNRTGQLNPDTILENRYIIIKTLGQGGMGAVYMALDSRLNNTPVAVKEMSTRAVGGDLQAAIASFKKEASMLISLRHGSLPAVRDFFAKGEDRWYLVMDYIEGQTLKDIAQQRGPIPEAEVLDWARQLGEILEYLHQQSPPIIFRDLKPANIMLTPEGKIKLIDFGIARHFRQGSTSDTSAYGSSGFAPPEQYGQNQTDERADIYALGASLHCLITGIDPIISPFQFEPPSKFVKLSPQMEKAIMKAVELKVQDRPGKMREFMDLLPQVPGKAAVRNVVPADKSKTPGIDSSVREANPKDKGNERPATGNISAVPPVNAQIGKNEETTTSFADKSKNTASFDLAAQQQAAVTGKIDVLPDNTGTAQKNVPAAEVGGEAKTAKMAADNVISPVTKVNPVSDNKRGGKGVLIAAGILILLMIGGLVGYNYLSPGKDDIKIATEAPKTSIDAILLAKGIDSDMAAVGEATSFTNDTPQICALINLNQATKDVIVGNWYYTNNGERELVCADKLWPHGKKKVCSVLNADQFKAGTWQFEADLNNQTCTADFTINDKSNIAESNEETPVPVAVPKKTSTSKTRPTNNTRATTGTSGTYTEAPPPTDTSSQADDSAPVSESYDNRPPTVNDHTLDCY